ncbi:MAG: hypothetical protein KDC46_05350 [Thermoleophilia bacterium]|nr:hypothetical protein [Thermoleophilia bacterium]
MATVQSAPAVTPQVQSLPTTALASPYDGTNPAGGMPIMGNQVGGAVPQLTGLSSGRPQVNATNQTALAQGDVNQTVTNSNQYTNKYYNIVVPNGYGGIGSSFGGISSLFGGWNSPGNSFIDPKTGVLYVQQETGFTGWLKRLFRGY